VCGVRGVAVKGGVDEGGGYELFDGFVTKVSRDGLPSASVVTFHEGEEKFKRAVVAVMSKTGHRGATTGHVAVPCKLTAHRAA
jgi:hypothetical protein